MTESGESTTYQAGKDISERWGIGIYEAQVFLIRHEYWSYIKDE